MVFILAGNYAQYRNCIHRLGLHPKAAPHLVRCEQLMGLDGPHVICYGTYWDGRDYPDLMEALRTRRARFASLGDVRRGHEKDAPPPDDSGDGARGGPAQK